MSEPKVVDEKDQGTTEELTKPQDYPLLLKLILAQLVNEKGEESFESIADDLRNHQLLQSMNSREMTAEVSICLLSTQELSVN